MCSLNQISSLCLITGRQLFLHDGIFFFTAVDIWYEDILLLDGNKKKGLGRFSLNFSSFKNFLTI